MAKAGHPLHINAAAGALQPDRSAAAELKNIMVTIYKNASTAAEEYGCPGNFVVGANIADFQKVARAMMAQGLV